MTNLPTRRRRPSTHNLREDAGSAGRAAWLLATMAVAAIATPASASRSILERLPDDPRAVVVHGKGDGRADDGPAIQAAIDQAAAHPGSGLVFLPAGNYRITNSLFLWPGVRLFGAGATRPRILLGAKTPGFGPGVHSMLLFTGAKPGSDRHVPFPPPDSVPFNPNIAEATPSTFYSAISNVDFAIGAGNPGAVAIRFHAAQHAYLAHIDFDLGSGLAGIYQVANEAFDLRFRGGRYGILTEKPSPAWQFSLLDSEFQGQREAAIREHEAQLTLVNVAFRDVPVGVSIDPGYGDWLWGKDVRFERVAKAGVIVSNEGNAYTQIGFENAVAQAMPTFVRFRESGRTVTAPAPRYRVSDFGYGLFVPALGQMGEYRTRFEATKLSALPPHTAPALPALPRMAEWHDVRAEGAKGDDRTDDTAAIQHAIDTHRVVYFPAGFYHVTDTLRLKPDTVLIGLHPSLTQILLPDGTPAYQGVGPAKAVIESASGGNAIVSGLGLHAGGINPRATALLWRAGAGSLVDDVKFQGGHGTELADGTLRSPYNANQSGDPDPKRRWDAQYPSLWVKDGGGGTFNGLWSPDTYAQAGFQVTNTTTPGHVYQLSNEHHARVEIGLDHAANWEFLAPQTEEEAGESGNAASFEIRDSRNILIANWHAYRVTRSLKPAPAAARLFGENEIRFRNAHVNAESGFATCDGGCATYLRASKYPYENAIQDLTHGLDVREREFAALDVALHPAAVTPATMGAAPVKRAGDFSSLGGGTVDSKGRLFFVDHPAQRILSWDAQAGLNLVSDHPFDAVALAAAASGDLLVLSSDGAEGTVFSLAPDKPGAPITLVPPTPATGGNPAILAIPANYWVNGEFKDQYDPTTDRFITLAGMFTRDMGRAKPTLYLAPDGSVALPAYRAFRQGPTDFRGWRFSDPLDASGLLLASPGAPVFVSNGSEDRTYRGVLGADGAVTGLARFAPRGGESVAVAPDGRVFVANGQVFAYDAQGTQIGRIDVPERPLQLLFGGPDKRTLFILTRHSLYTAQP
jgi:hypothetical protein